VGGWVNGVGARGARRCEGFAPSNEGRAAAELLEAFENNAPDTLQACLSRQVFTFLDGPVRVPSSFSPTNPSVGWGGGTHHGPCVCMCVCAASADGSELSSVPCCDYPHDGASTCQVLRLARGLHVNDSATSASSSSMAPRQQCETTDLRAQLLARPAAPARCVLPPSPLFSFRSPKEARCCCCCCHLLTLSSRAANVPTTNQPTNTTRRRRRSWWAWVSVCLLSR
jgi:hypothetical protein